MFERVCAQGSLAEAQILEERLRDADDAALKHTATVVHEQLADVAVVVVTGCPDAECNGHFLPAPVETEMEGELRWPHFRNQQGKHLFYLEAASQWVIHSEVVERFGTVDVHHGTADGLLPLGTTSWVCRNAVSTEDDAPPPTEPPPPVDPPAVRPRSCGLCVYGRW